MGTEINKTRPCLIISPDEINDNLNNVIVAPMTSTSKGYPSRVSVYFEGKNGYIVLDQIKTLDKIRFLKKLGSIDEKTIQLVKQVIQEMLVD